MEGRTVGAGGDQRGCALALGTVGGSIEEARDEQLVVRVVVGGGNLHLAGQTGDAGSRFPVGNCRRAEAGRVGGRQPEVARPRRRRQRTRRGRQGNQVGMEAGALRTGRDQALGLGALAIREVLVEQRSDQTIRGLGRGPLDPAAPRWSAAGSVRRRKPAHQPRNSSIRPSRRPRNASRPRWIRDLTVPSETPVMSAISA